MGGEGVAVTVLVPYEVADRCYLSEALLWAAFSRLPLKILNDQADTRDEGNYDAAFVQSPEIEPVTSDECKRIGLSPRPIPESADSHLSLEDLCLRVERERSDDKKYQLQRAHYEAVKFQSRLSDWYREFDKFVDEPRLKILQALQEERLCATGKMLPRSTIMASVEFMAKESWSPPQHIDRERIPPDFWSAAEIDWGESFAEGHTEDREVAYGLILVDVAHLLKEFPLPNGDPYGGVRKAGDYLVLTSPDEIRGGPKQGRPPFRWDEFHLQMTKRVMEGLPPKKDAFILEMEEWCLDKWNHRVGKSTLAQMIKPYYDKFVWKSETQKE
jgi:hypothetical protein